MDRQLTETEFWRSLLAKAYNHNLDTSPEHYPNIVSTRVWVWNYGHMQFVTSKSNWVKGVAKKRDNNERTHGVSDASQAAGTYADRLETLANVREAGISVSR